MVNKNSEGESCTSNFYHVSIITWLIIGENIVIVNDVAFIKYIFSYSHSATQRKTVTGLRLHSYIGGKSTPFSLCAASFNGYLLSNYEL